MKEDQREITTKENVRVVTSNGFVTAEGIEGLSLNARKLLYLAIAQCKKDDDQFYEYEISAKDFADLLGIQTQNLYSNLARDEKSNLNNETYSITTELLHTLILVRDKNSDSGWDRWPLFSQCSYHAGVIKFRFNESMTKYFLHLRMNFTQPLLNDFLHMKSKYSMAVWHLMQMHMGSLKPGVSNVIEFDLDLDELRRVTGTEKKLKKISEFKSRVLDVAIKEIHDQCYVDVTYTNRKRGRRIIGFHFVAKNSFYIDEKSVSQDVKDHILDAQKRIAAAQRERE